MNDFDEMAAFEGASLIIARLWLRVRNPI